MRIVRNRLIPFPGFIAVNLFGVLFVRSELAHKLSDRVLRHEAIHTAQMRELLYVPFYLIYLLEWIVRLFLKGDAYMGISFEREAYGNEDNPEYLSRRRRFAMWRK